MKPYGAEYTVQKSDCIYSTTAGLLMMSLTMVFAQLVQPHGADSSVQMLWVPAHHTTIPKAIGEVIKPEFDRLCDRALLKRCLRGGTQNPNESLHATICEQS